MYIGWNCLLKGPWAQCYLIINLLIHIVFIVVAASTFNWEDWNTKEGRWASFQMVICFLKHWFNGNLPRIEVNYNSQHPSHFQWIVLFLNQGFEDRKIFQITHNSRTIPKGIFHINFREEACRVVHVIDSHIIQGKLKCSLYYWVKYHIHHSWSW